MAVAGPFTTGSAFLTSYLAFNHDMTAALAVTLSAVVGLLMYCSVFVWLGLVTKQAIGVGLVYIVLWEGFFSGYVGAIGLFLALEHLRAELGYWIGVPFWNPSPSTAGYCWH